jgi:hypothetical protein
MPLRPIHRSPFSPHRRPPERPDRAAAAIRGARIGAVLAAAVAIALLSLRGSRVLAYLPFDPQILVAVAFFGPILVGFLRPGVPRNRL